MLNYFLPFDLLVVYYQYAVVEELKYFTESQIYHM